VQAGRAFVAFMLGQERSDADRFLAEAGTFLGLLQTVDPARYTALVAKAEDASTQLDGPCIAALEPLRRLYESRLTPLAELVRDLAAVAHAPGGPHA
jgi:streptomycin 6-kinase